MNAPFFSIITVSFNAEDTIEETIRSVLSQTFTDYEIIVKDGVSADDTMKRIPEDGRIRAFSEPDVGVYDAMNQAIEKATGQYLCFLNCGDSFYSNEVLADIRKSITAHEDKLAVYYGNYETCGDFTQSPASLSRYGIYRNPLCHQTMFIPHIFFEELGLYRSDFRILSDYEFTVHAQTVKKAFYNTGVTVCRYLGGGISTQKKYRKNLKNEYRWIKKKYFTKKERIAFGLRRAITLPGLRRALASDRAPAFLRKWYKGLANKAKKGT